jgi:hypothetical protein
MSDTERVMLPPAVGTLREHIAFSFSKLEQETGLDRAHLCRAAQGKQSLSRQKADELVRLLRDGARAHAMRTEAVLRELDDRD